MLSVPGWRLEADNNNSTAPVLSLSSVCPQSGGAMTDNLAVDRIYCGDMTELQHPVAPVLRLYIASTFTDMVLEKTELVNHIFPALKEYCKLEHDLKNITVSCI